jgi:hypothetical protein
VAFLGDNGTLVVDRSGWLVTPEKDVNRDHADKIEVVEFQPAESNDRDLHALDFVNAIKARKDPICTIEEGANVSRLTQLGNISLRVGRKVYWDKVNNRIVNDPESEHMGMANYREPWKLKKF